MDNPPGATSEFVQPLKVVVYSGQLVQVKVHWNRKLATEFRFKKVFGATHRLPGLQHVLQHCLMTGTMPEGIDAEFDAKLAALNVRGHWSTLRGMPGFRVWPGEQSYVLYLAWTCTENAFEASEPQQLAIQAVKDFMEEFLILIKGDGKRQKGRNIVPPRAHLEFVGSTPVGEAVRRLCLYLMSGPIARH